MPLTATIIRAILHGSRFSGKKMLSRNEMFGRTETTSKVKTDSFRQLEQIQAENETSATSTPTLVEPLKKAIHLGTEDQILPRNRVAPEEIGECSEDPEGWRGGKMKGKGGWGVPVGRQMRFKKEPFTVKSVFEFRPHRVGCGSLSALSDHF